MSDTQEDDENIAFLKVRYSGRRNFAAEAIEAVENMYSDIHVEVIQGYVVDFDSTQNGGTMIDIMNDDHIKELLAAAPDDQREEIKKAVDQIRSLAESMNAVSTGHSEIRGQVRDLNSRTGRLQHKLSEALMRAKASRKKFGY